MLISSAFVTSFAPTLRRTQHPNTWRCSVSPPENKESTTAKPARDKATVVAPPTPSFFEILADRTRDTLDDVNLHYGRLFKREEVAVRAKKRHIVVLGSGWGAHSFIKVVDTDAYNVTVVSPRNFYFFTPLLAATAVGTVEFRSIVDPMRRANPLVDFYEAAATEVDVARSEVLCEPVNGDSAPFRVAYDYLLVAVGERAATFGIPGVREYAHFLKELTDSVRLRRAILTAFEQAALPGIDSEERRRLLQFVVVGGGPTGCEFAGELSDFVSSDVFKKYNDLRGLVQVTLLQSRDAILTSFETSLQGRALEQFEGRHIDVRLNSRVKEVTAEAVVLGDGTVLGYGVLVWAAGNGPRPVVKRLANAVNEAAGSEVQPEDTRKIEVDDWMFVRGTKNIFALGDCARMPVPLPATAQVAGQQGAYMARVLRRWDAREEVDAEETSNGSAKEWQEEWRESIKPFRFLSLGAMTYIGDASAVVQMEAGENSPKLAISGFISYLIWLSTYAVKQVATRNRVLVLFDVLKSKVFGRDVSQF